MVFVQIDLTSFVYIYLGKRSRACLYLCAKNGSLKIYAYTAYSWELDFWVFFVFSSESEFVFQAHSTVHPQRRICQFDTLTGYNKKVSSRVRFTDILSTEQLSFCLHNAYPGCQRVFFLLFAVKIERQSRDCDEWEKNPLVTAVTNLTSMSTNQ